MSKISIFYLVSEAEQTGLSVALLENPEDRFSRDKAHLFHFSYIPCVYQGR